MEVRLKTPEKYRFPAFETLQWYAAKYYTQFLKDSNSRRECRLTLKFYNCLKLLQSTLKKWINSKDVSLIIMKLKALGKNFETNKNTPNRVNQPRNERNPAFKTQ